MLVLLSHLSLAIASQTVLSSQTTADYYTQSHIQHQHFDPLLHLPGISPYYDAAGFGLEHSAPLGCNVTAASYLVRHAAIYANDDDYEKYIEPFLEKLNSSKREKWTGPLSLFQDWTSPYTDIDKQMEQITPDGVHDSTLVGKHLLRRYPDLTSTTKKVYADKKARTQDTAKAFVKAFSQKVEIVEISSEMEFESTIPHKSCPRFSKSAGDNELHQFIAYYTRGPILRLQPHSPVSLTPNDIIGMQQLCGYESAITGSKSPLCPIFTSSEWLSYEYAWDLKYNYMVGPGNPLSPYLGFPWLNVTAKLFSNFHRIDDEARANKHHGTQRFFLSFAHREVPPFLATALGIFSSPRLSSNISSISEPDVLPTSSINFQRAWKMSELIPFLGHIGIEKMTCDRSSGALGDEDQDGDGLSEWVRIIANSAVRPLPRCQGGPGASCGFTAFEAFVREGMEVYGDFKGVCGVKDDVAVEWR